MLKIRYNTVTQQHMDSKQNSWRNADVLQQQETPVHIAEIRAAGVT